MIDFLIKSIKKLTCWSFEAVSLANASVDMKMSPQGVPYPTTTGGGWVFKNLLFKNQMSIWFLVGGEAGATVVGASWRVVGVSGPLCGFL